MAVLTRLSSYSSLAVVLFTVGMVITLWRYNTYLARLMMPIVVLSILSITNVQTFSFIAILNTAVMWMLIAVIVTVVGEFPFSSSPEALFRRLYGRFTRLTARITAGLPMAWGYRSAIGTPSQLQALLGTLDPEHLPTSHQRLEALVTGCHDCRFWLGIWWSREQRCRGLVASRRKQPDGAFAESGEGPDHQLSQAIAHLSETIQRCEQICSTSSAEHSGIDAAAAESCLGASLQLRWCLSDLATLSSQLHWQHWPRPPLPWS